MLRGPFGRPHLNDPTQPVTTLKNRVAKSPRSPGAGMTTLATELAESGASDFSNKFI